MQLFLDLSSELILLLEETPAWGGGGGGSLSMHQDDGLMGTICDRGMYCSQLCFIFKCLFVSWRLEIYRSSR